MELRLLRFVPLALLVAAALPLTSFAEPRMHPQAYSRAGAIHTVGIVSHDVTVYEISAGGVKEQHDEWSQKGRENVRIAAEAVISARERTAKPLPPGAEREQPLKEVLALYDAVAAMIMYHVNGPWPFPDKLAGFDYSVGPIDDIADRYGVDALLVMQGMDEIATGGKKVMNTLGVLSGIALGGLTGTYIGPKMPQGFLRGALIARSGEVLWLNFAGGVRMDLREGDGTKAIVAEMLASLPAGGKQ